ncbi:hypothetical protein [Mucilaginibacter sp. CSA2-8R]|uniref:hypothetical protein n=1 Tax=Mucilaginibacter sp. CSA2-8R TaxID=3141542 RepID=UPI00315CB99D
MAFYILARAVENYRRRSRRPDMAEIRKTLDGAVDRQLAELQTIIDEMSVYTVANDYLTQQNPPAAPSPSPATITEKEPGILEQVKRVFIETDEDIKAQEEHNAHLQKEAQANQITENVPVLSIKGYSVSDGSRNDGWCLNAGYYFVLKLINTRPEPIKHILVSFGSDFVIDQLTDTEQPHMYTPGSTTFKYTLHDAKVRKDLMRNTDFKIWELPGMSEKVICAFPVTTRFNGHLNADKDGQSTLYLSCFLNWQGGHNAFYFISYRYEQPGDLKVFHARVTVDDQRVPIIGRYLKNNTEVKDLV